MANETSKSLVLVSKQNGIVVIPGETPLTRLNYFDGKFLRASDLKAEQDYLRHLVRLSNQADGSGVAHGFDVRLGGGDTIDIGPGLAIDAEGRVLLMPQGTTISIQDLIDKSLDLQTIYGKSEIKKNDSFETCEQITATPPDNITHPNNLYVIVISAAEALCGEEDVYGKLCEEACSTTTDRPLAVEGLIVRAVPLVLQTPLPNPKAVTITTQTHYRSRVASAYFQDERNRLANLISAQGLKQQTWCLGADSLGNGGVAIGVFARAGSTPIFLDPWIVRRELIDTPARRYWQWRMMMRPWDVFLAQVLQFQCQLHELYQKFPDPGVAIDPCSGARDALKEAATTIYELKQFYEKTSQQFTYLNVDMSKAITLPGGWTALDSLKTKLENVGQGFALLPPDQWLINGGIIELPSAGYLPVVPDGNVTVNDQVRRMMGKGVDLRFCVVSADFVAHALEEAQHMERISLIEGLENAAKIPQVDILVPDGEIVEEKKVIPSGSYEADIDVFVPADLSKNVSAFGAEPGKQTTVPIVGAAYGENSPDGRRAIYLALRLDQENLFKLEDPLKSSFGAGAQRQVGEVEAGLWGAINCSADLTKLTVGQKFRIEGDAIGAFGVGLPDGTDKSGSAEGLFRADVIVKEVTNIGGNTVANCTVTASGRLITQVATNEDLKKGAATFDAEINLGKPGGLDNSIEITVQDPNQRGSIRVTVTWGKQPKEIEALVYVTTTRNGVAEPEQKIMRARFLSNPEVLRATNINHVQAVEGLQLIGSVTDDSTFVAAKSALLFHPVPEIPATLTVRGTHDWVMFHRRRNKNCGTPTVAPAPRRYRVYQFAATPERIRELGAIADLVPEAPLTTDQILKTSPKLPKVFLPIGEVTFGGGVVTFVGDISALKNAWKKIPDGKIVWGAIGSRDEAMTDGESLAVGRLKTLEAALDQVSPSARADVLPIVPPSLASPDVDGVIVLTNYGHQPQPSADLAITKLDSPDPVIPGSNITYVLQVSNGGPTAATDVTVTDLIPGETNFVSASVLSSSNFGGNGWQTTPPTGGTGTVLFKKASLAAAETATFQIVVKVNSTLTSAMTITNTATVSSPTADPNPANNSATTTTTVTPPASADLRITKTASPSKDAAGLPIIVYTLTATNAGPSPAQTVTVTDAVPANTTFVSARILSGSGWIQANPSGGGTGNVTFKKPSVAVAETSSFEIIVKINPGLPTTIITNT
ncbi:MAG TPA: DUF11 domain-containing protein, partial [Pyrinomonadaceae bacterium]|nr:DUF11 domain-containing protein [Pyrinomonadaceae bacterium]